MKKCLLSITTAILLFAPIKVNASSWGFWVSDSVSGWRELASSEPDCDKKRAAYIRDNPGFWVGSCETD